MSATVDTGSIARRLGSQTAIVLLGSLFTLAVGLPLQIYVARILGAAELGVFSLLEGAVGIATGLLSFGLAPTLVKFIPSYLERRDYQCVGLLLKKGVVIIASAGSLAYLAIIASFPWVLDLWPDLAQHQEAILLMGALIPLTLLSYFFSQGLRGFQEIRYMVFGSSVLQIMVKTAAALLLFALGSRLFGYVVAVVLASTFGAAWMLRGLLMKVAALPAGSEPRCSDTAGDWWRYAGVMYANSLIGLSGAYLDRFLIGFFFGAGPVGVLAVVRLLQQLPAMFLQMSLTVASPMFAASHSRGDFEETVHLYHLMTDWVVRAALPLLIFLVVFAEPLLHLFGAEFSSAGRGILVILVGAQAFNLVCGPVGAILWVSDLERPMLRLSFYQTLLTVAALATLIPLLGLYGAGIALAMNIVYINVATLILARRQLGIRWWDRRYMRWTLPTAAACAAALYIRHLEAGDGVAWILAGAVVLVYVVFHGVSLLQGLHEDDKELLRYLGRRFGFARE